MLRKAGVAGSNPVGLIPMSKENIINLFGHKNSGSLSNEEEKRDAAGVGFSCCSWGAVNWG